MFVCLFVRLFVTILFFIQLAWTTPPFIKPEKLDVAVKDWTYVELTKGTNIILDEEVDHEIFLAEINYNGIS